MCTEYRTDDIDGLLAVMDDAQKFVYIAVMDYYPITLYTSDTMWVQTKSDRWQTYNLFPFTMQRWFMFLSFQQILACDWRHDSKNSHRKRDPSAPSGQSLEPHLTHYAILP